MRKSSALIEKEGEICTKAFHIQLKITFNMLPEMNGGGGKCG